MLNLARLICRINRPQLVGRRSRVYVALKKKCSTALLDIITLMQKRMHAADVLIEASEAGGSMCRVTVGASLTVRGYCAQAGISEPHDDVGRQRRSVCSHQGLQGFPEVARREALEIQPGNQLIQGFAPSKVRWQDRRTELHSLWLFRRLSLYLGPLDTDSLASAGQNLPGREDNGSRITSRWPRTVMPICVLGEGVVHFHPSMADCNICCAPCRTNSSKGLAWPNWDRNSKTSGSSGSAGLRSAAVVTCRMAYPPLPGYPLAGAGR